MAKKSRHRSPFVRVIVHLAEAALVYFFVALFAVMPLRMASGFGGWIGRHVGPRIGVSRRAKKHLKMIFPEKSKDEIKAILCDMWDNLGRNAAELPHLETLKRSDRYITIEGAHHIREALESGRPPMMISGHFANWEIAPMSMIMLGAPMAGVYRRPNNPYVDRLLGRLRKPIAPALFDKGTEGARGIMRWMREGRPVGLLVDQKMNAGEAMDFLGKPAMTGLVPAQMAIMTKAVILPAQIIRLRGCFFRVVVHPPLMWDEEASKDEKILDMTQKINDFLSDHIRAYPAQWLWLHRRWKMPAHRTGKHLHRK